MNDDNIMSFRNRLGWLFVPLSAAVIWFLPLGLEQNAQRLLTLFVAVIIAWITEVLPIAITSLLIGPFLVLSGITNTQTAFAPYADPLLFLFVGGFFLAKAMSLHGLDRRIARHILGFKIIQGSPTKILLAFTIAGAFLSMWISNTASTTILMPILLGAFFSSKKEEEETASLQIKPLLLIAYTCSLGGMGTLVGSPPNVITARLLQANEIDFGFIQWMNIGLPISIVLITALFIVFYFTASEWRNPSNKQNENNADSRISQPLSFGEKVTAGAFLLAILGWLIPGILKTAQIPGAASLSKMLPSGVVALMAASILFVFPDKKHGRVLPWKEAIQIDWGVIFLFGGGLSLGYQMVETGLAKEMSQWIIHSTGVENLWSLTFVAIAFTVFFTEVCSNMASANILVPLVIATASQLQVSVIPPALAVGLAASCAFMLPIATGPNAIVYSTNKVSLSTMSKYGFGLNILSVFTIFFTLRILCPIFGWD